MARNRVKITLSEEQRLQMKDLWESVKDKKFRKRLLVIRAAQSGVLSYEEIAGLAGCARSTVGLCLQVFVEGGFDRLLQRGKPKPPKSPLHNEQLQEEIRLKLKAGTFRTAKQTLTWLKTQHQVTRSLKTIYRWLKFCGATLLVPRPVHLKKNQQRTDAFPVELEQKLTQLPLVKGRPVRIWVQDECRVGLHTVVRRAWGLKGHRIVLPNQKKYEWSYVYGAMEVGTGRLHTHMISQVSLTASQAFLENLAASEPEAEHIVIWDGAGFHQKEGKHKLPDRLHVIQLPPYSPELNPIEKLWDVIKDGICNRIFPTLEELWEAIITELKPFHDQASRVWQILGNPSLIALANASS